MLHYEYYSIIQLHDYTMMLVLNNCYGGHVKTWVFKMNVIY
jgi:hypothetical protein